MLQENNLDVLCEMIQLLRSEIVEEQIHPRGKKITTDVFIQTLIKVFDGGTR